MKIRHSHIFGLCIGTLLCLVLFPENIKTAIMFNSISIMLLVILTDKDIKKIKQRKQRINKCHMNYI